MSEEHRSQCPFHAGTEEHYKWWQITHAETYRLTKAQAKIETDEHNRRVAIKHGHFFGVLRQCKCGLRLSEYRSWPRHHRQPICELARGLKQ